MKPSWPAKERDDVDGETWRVRPGDSSCIVTGMGVGRWEKGLLMIAPRPWVIVAPFGRRMPCDGEDIMSGC